MDKKKKVELMSCPKCKCDWFEERDIGQYDKTVISFLTSIIPETRKLLYVCVECGYTMASPKKQVFKDIKIVVFERVGDKMKYIESVAPVGDSADKKTDKISITFKHLKVRNNVHGSISNPNAVLLMADGFNDGSDIEYEYCGLPDTKTILLTNKEYSAVNEKIKQDYPEDKYNVEIVDRTED